MAQKSGLAKASTSVYNARVTAPKHPPMCDFAERPFILFWEVTRACALACKHCRAIAQPKAHPEELNHEEALALVDEIAEYIAAHYAVIEDLSFVREQFHYSAVHVNTLFRQQLGVSLWRYVLHIRLDRACDMLVNGIHASEAALSCGFKDYSTFYRLFKKSYGITPTECRRMGKKPKMIS